MQIKPISVCSFEEPPICEKEILRYAGCKPGETIEDTELLRLLAECLAEVRPKLRYRVCFTTMTVETSDEVCRFDGHLSVSSRHLARNLHGCEEVLLFAATIGVEIDRLIAKYGRISPTKALLFQAIGAERIEALCDLFCDTYGKGLRPRFSPGYGDLSLEMQKDIFAYLDCAKHIGLTLNDSLLMSPSKSVTAFAGIDKTNASLHTQKCASCSNTDCAFREA